MRHRIGEDMLTILCEDRTRNCPRDTMVCCCECSDSNCENRCIKTIDETCDKFFEDID
jgi:hypothetical protein